MIHSASSRRRVALLVESSRSFGRGIVRSIAEWVRERQDWEVFYQDCGLGELLPQWFSTWEGDGVIARLENQRIMKAVAAKRLPVVDVRGSYPVPGIPIVRTCDETVARLAAEHFMERGFRQLAFCGYRGADFSERRCEALVRYAEEAGLSVHVYAPRGRRRISGVRQSEQHGLIYEDSVAPWISSLPKPIGVVACNDVRGHQLLSACREVGVSVPEEVAVLGVDNYDVLCELSTPPLSSIEQNMHRIARRAATVLEDLMDGKRVPMETELIEPVRLITRQSSDVLAVDDPDVVQALRFIRQHAVQGIRVTDILNEVLVSRRELERRFEKLLGRSPRQEIQRVRFQRIKQLLVDTDLPIHIVARRTGFEYAEHMNTAFKRYVGMTPGQYRLRNRPTRGDE